MIIKRGICLLVEIYKYRGATAARRVVRSRSKEKTGFELREALFSFHFYGPVLQTGVNQLSADGIV